MKTQDTNLKLIKAKNKVEKLKRFYTHLTVYVVINTVISVVKISNNMNNGESFETAFFEFETFIVWMVWGIAIGLHAFSVFGITSILGEDWEERKIQELMKKDLETFRK